VPSAFGNKASAGREEGDNAGKEQDFFHLQFVSLSAVRLRNGRALLYGGYDPTVITRAR
jgi:hypothetical protein